MARDRNAWLLLCSLVALPRLLFGESWMRGAAHLMGMGRSGGNCIHRPKREVVPCP